MILTCNYCLNITLTGLQIVDVSSVAYSNQSHQLKQVNCTNLTGSSFGTHNMADLIPELKLNSKTKQHLSHIFLVDPYPLLFFVHLTTKTLC